MKWGIAWGVGYALLGALYAIVSGAGRSAEYNELGVTIWTVLSTYVVVGVVGGSLVGLLRPLLRRAAGVALAGWLVGSVALAAIGISVSGLSPTPVVTGLVLGALVGPPIAFLLRGWRS